MTRTLHDLLRVIPTLMLGFALFGLGIAMVGDITAMLINESSALKAATKELTASSLDLAVCGLLIRWLLGREP